MALELHLQSLLDEYLHQEEALWKSKSRELWLTGVDLNTKFFHTSTLIRRRRNSITLLQSPNSGWLSDRKDIGDCFVNNFKDIFTSTNPTPHEDLLALSIALFMRMIIFYFVLFLQNLRFMLLLLVWDSLKLRGRMGLPLCFM